MRKGHCSIPKKVCVWPRCHTGAPSHSGTTLWLSWQITGRSRWGSVEHPCKSVREIGTSSLTVMTSEMRSPVLYVTYIPEKMEASLLTLPTIRQARFNNLGLTGACFHFTPLQSPYYKPNMAISVASCYSFEGASDITWWCCRGSNPGFTERGSTSLLRGSVENGQSSQY